VAVRASRASDRGWRRDTTGARRRRGRQAGARDSGKAGAAGPCPFFCRRRVRDAWSRWSLSPAGPPSLFLLLLRFGSGRLGDAPETGGGGVNTRARRVRVDDWTCGGGSGRRSRAWLAAAVIIGGESSESGREAVAGWAVTVRGATWARRARL
jgi:hypothetical protein